MNVIFAVFISLICLASRQVPAATSFYDTYAAWGDVSNARHGHLYIYTGGAASTDYFLYSTGTAGTTINNLVSSNTGIGPYRPAFSYPNEDGPVGFGNMYFKLSSTEPMTWEVDENTSCHCGDAHGMVAAADNLNSYIGSIFMTYMRRDTDPEVLNPPFFANQFGDQLAVVSTASGPITASVSRWNGAAWIVMVASSPVIPAGGVWMWSPNQSSPPRSGGTLAANAGHYRVDLSGGQGMLYKGNVFSPMPYQGHGYAWNRDNALMVSPDMATGRKIGSNLFGVVVADHASAPQVVVSNMGTAPANFDLLRFVPTTPGIVDLEWPIHGNDPTGIWTTVQSVAAVPVGGRWSYTSPGDGFMRVVATNGQPLTAIMGTALTRSKYTGGDYVYARDTNQAIGKAFDWWGHLTGAGAGEPLELHVVCPWPNTQVTVNATGNASQVQTSTGADQGLKFNITSSVDQDIRFTLTSNQYVYVWFMSNTVGSVFGETFFSNPPMPQDLVVAEKSANVGTATIGDTITYLLTARNIGAGNALSVMLWDTIPAGMTLQSSNPAPVYSVPPLYGWDLSTVPALSSSTVTITASVNTAINGEIKNNSIQISSATAPSAQSPNAPVRILIPGADLQKSANVTTAVPGDTVTYSITYFNPSPALPVTPRFNLRTRGMLFDANSMTYIFEITNHSGAAVNINDLRICYWIQDSMAPASINFFNDYGGDTTPWVWGGAAMSGAAFTVSPAIVRPDSRNANLQICWTPTSGQSLANGTIWSNINLRCAVNFPIQWNTANMAGLNYSRRPVEASPVEDLHYALYYQGSLVTEYTSPGTADLNTGVEPYYSVAISDTCPAAITYVGSNPAATLTGLDPLLSWFDPAVLPQESVSFTWWGLVKAGTAQGTVINNRADAQANSISAISNMVTIVVPVVGTLTFTPTRTPSATVTATRTPSPSPSITPTSTLTPSFSYTPTPADTPTPLPTLTPTPPPLILHLFPNSPNPFGAAGTHLAYFIAVDAIVDIKVYDVSGELVRQLDPFNGRQGNNEQFWDAKNSFGAPIASGTYIYRVTATSAAREVISDFAKCAAIK